MKDNRQQTIQFENAFAEIFSFDNETEVREYHVMIHVNSSRLPYTQQLEAVLNAYNQLVNETLRGARPSSSVTSSAMQLTRLMTSSWPM